MRTKRNLVTFALGGVVGYLVGRYPAETYEKVRGAVGMTAGLARERLPFGHSGDHRAPTEQPPEASAGAGDRPHP